VHQEDYDGEGEDEDQIADGEVYREDEIEYFDQRKGVQVEGRDQEDRLISFIIAI
jgi:hypothetical protein